MDLSLQLIPAIKVTIIFVLWLLVIPGWYSFDRRGTDFLGRVFRNFTQGVLFTIVTVYVLAALKLFEEFSVLLLLAGYVAFVRVGFNKTLLLRLQSFAVMVLGNYFDWLERRINWRKQIGRKIGLGRLWGWVRRLTLLDWATGALFGLAVWLRFYPRIINLTLVAPINAGPAGGDPYVHLTWAKQLRDNILFPDGIYPMGYHAILGTIQGVSQQDYYHVVRFTGPIGASLLVLAFYWFLTRVTSSRRLALLGTAVFALSTVHGLPIPFDRQIVSLPMEFAMIFMFPGLIYLHDYLGGGDQRDLYLYGCCVANTMAIHSYTAVFLGVGSFGLFISALTCGHLRRKFAPLAAVGLGAGVAGNLPFLLASLAGMPWHSTSRIWVADNLSQGSGFDLKAGLNQIMLDGDGALIFAAAALLALLLLLGLLQLSRDIKQRDLWPQAAFGMLGILMFLYVLPRCGGPSLVGDRLILPFYLSLVTAAVLPLKALARIEYCKFQWPPLDMTQKAWARILSLGTIGLIGTWIWLFPPELPAFDPHNRQVLEYPAAVRTYFSIKKEFPPHEWTIVGPVEQYEEALGYGFHYELWEFIEDFPVSEAGASTFDPAIPTAYIFVFVEKVPLQIWEEGVLASTEAQFVGPTQIYYRDSQGRARLEQALADWCEAYASSHDNISTYYEDEVLKVYLIEHDPRPYV